MSRVPSSSTTRDVYEQENFAVRMIVGPFKPYEALLVQSEAEFWIV